jgi:molybdate transport system substrate-binding protein
MQETLISYRHYPLYAWQPNPHNPLTFFTLAMTSRAAPPTLTALSSMATRALLAELARGFEHATGMAVAVTSVGGVEAAKRVAAGEPFDLVLLARDALDKLVAAHLVHAGLVDWVQSPMALAVQAGQPVPPLHTEDQLKAAVLAAPRVGCSTGPSGQHLLRLFQRWGVADDMASRTVQVPPGVPVGGLVASGDVALGFQQLSELQGLSGITLAGELPPGCAFVTTFSGGVSCLSTWPELARSFLAHLAAPGHDDTKRQHGMSPA